MSSNNNYRLHLKAVQIFKTTGIQDMTKTETRDHHLPHARATLLLRKQIA